jgi:protocatechuate 3,4-dioxygenase beta subunit
MRTSVAASLVTLAAAIAVSAQDTRTTRELSISGVVVDAENGAVLRRARIGLGSDLRQLNAVFTDNDGRFVITTSSPTAPTLRVSKAGYAHIVVPVATDSEPELRIALVRSAAVMGRVVDVDGFPVSNAYVTGRLFSPDTNRPTAASRQFYASTDRLGEYRLGGLPAGRYEIRSVRIPPELMAPGTSVEERLFGPPQVLEVAHGTTTSLTLAPGAEVRSVDFRLAVPHEECATGPSVRPAPGTIAAAISGRVVAASGEPIPCAAVRIVSPDPPVPGVYTDPQGRFTLDGLPADGTFVLEARKSGFLTLQYGQDLPSDPEVPLAVGAGERITGVDVVLPRESVVSGVVTDEHGEPVEGVQVWAFELRRTGGRTVATSTVFTRPTDDRGQYRLIGAAPGEYVVGTLMRATVGGSRDTQVYTSTFHPSTRDAMSARRVSVAAGRDVDGADIVLIASPTAVVSGTVVDGEGRPLAGGRVSVAVSGRSGAAALDSWTGTTDAAGAFAMRDVPPGDYVVKASGADGAFQFGMQYVTVTQGNPAPVRVALTSGSTIEGRVIVEGGADVNLAGFTIAVGSADFDYSSTGQSGSSSTYARQDDGSFRVPGVTGPGRVVTQMPGCESCYLKSARVNGYELTESPFDFGLASRVYRDAEVVISDASATITGRVTEANGVSVANYAVVALPVRRDLWFPQSQYVRVGRPAGDGSFRMNGVPPGDYVIAAVNRLVYGSTEMYDPQVLEALAARGQRITVAEREQRAVDLRLIRR